MSRFLKDMLVGVGRWVSVLLTIAAVILLLIDQLFVSQKVFVTRILEGGLPQLISWGLFGVAATLLLYPVRTSNKIWIWLLAILFALFLFTKTIQMWLILMNCYILFWYWGNERNKEKLVLASVVANATVFYPLVAASFYMIVDWWWLAAGIVALLACLFHLPVYRWGKVAGGHGHTHGRGRGTRTPPRTRVRRRRRGGPPPTFRRRPRRGGPLMFP